MVGVKYEMSGMYVCVEGGNCSGKNISERSTRANVGGKTGKDDDSYSSLADGYIRICINQENHLQILDTPLQNFRYLYKSLLF